MKKYKLKSTTEQIIDDVLKFCNYYGVIVSTDNISITDDDTLILSDISETSFNIITFNLDTFIKVAFYNKSCYVKQFDINIKKIFDENCFYENGVTNYKDTYELKMKFDLIPYMMGLKIFGSPFGGNLK